MKWFRKNHIPREAREQAKRQPRDIEMASRAAKKAERELLRAEQVADEVESIVARSQERVRRNHIREAFEESLVRTVPVHRRRPL